ncbi:MAG: EamA family transporter [Alphaproteobacteria bacterium]|nr:EamA family transporter [Alphaproteobacteria bacterium]
MNAVAAIRAGVAPWIGWLLLIAFETGSQVFLKIGSGDLGGAEGLRQWLVAAVLSPAVVLGILCYALSFLSWMALLRDRDVSRAFPMTAIVYVTVLGVSAAALGEDVDLVRWLGVAVICGGVVLLAGDPDAPPEHGP